ncbi:hypothetical protein A2926_03870 [Candidatus Giovannonibacteria bacterium RIFCSPLOWO2_01_FULL_44_40]|uniref:ABC transporter substrate-binding protein n=1 Tax=Candidatus Giovannonibacteria bacterium RIFCSPHIGHO2_01_FULL_45_23 TaxID=1798325 RepID=A0A1F5VIV0_9BACT|nr:MAG: hypothetical protein A2834_04240 [Candidatus Giovannonibacteria bacterium RIFCSPHIGHO2_01_FULL_45_23]OGF75537.1 MAG: hypothetical protein A3C77_00760 [Candidatus Giovannonibacteria bacterium RIFCSPHIGHO2_02_FULL_45_13]OGF80048.1 MAG: hypothetical protein A2926_03870 [Candidatus Giovannonibacteria bacterium RIFCSPLOWO2_01_FULL_44_40]
MNKLQIVIIGIAILLTVIAVLIFTGVLPGLKSDTGRGAKLNVWGFADESVLTALASEFAASKQNFEIRFFKKDIQNFESDLLNVLASNGADVPDIVIFPSDYLKKHKGKLAAAPPIFITEREIKQQYVEAASAFIAERNQVLGIPLYADALLLFWNVDIFTKNLITLPPKTWDDFLAFAKKLTQKDNVGNIVISGAAMGRGGNIKNAPLILTTMFLQSGESIVKENGEVALGSPVSVGDTTLRPAESSLRFMTDFANPQKTSQSWSAALPEAEEMFIGGKLAMYLGKISEYNEIKSRNPHLNFAVALLPQLAVRPVTGGILYALTVPRASTNQQSAWEFIKFLTSAENSAAYADKTGNVSLQRGVLPNYQKESVRSVFAESVLALKLWLNPDPFSSNQIFRDLIEDVVLGRATLRDALEKAATRLGELK